MRTFVAIELPQDLKEKIGLFEKEIEKFVPLRFVAPRNLHLTLFFLGELEQVRISEAVEAVGVGVQGIKPFQLFLGKPEFFPKTGRIHGLWLEIEGQLEVLEKLHEQISQELEKRNFQFDRKPFSAHATIGRAKKRVKRKPLSNLAIGQLSKQKFKADSVSVFGSILKPEGPIYSKIETISLE